LSAFEDDEIEEDILYAGDDYSDVVETQSVVSHGFHPVMTPRLQQEFPVLSAAGKAQLIDDIQALFDKINQGNGYRPLMDKAYGKSQNERAMTLLKMDISAQVNGVGAHFHELDFREMVTSYALLKIKLTMTQKDALRSTLRKIQNKMYSARRKPGEPMPEAYYAEVANFVDSNYPAYRDLLMR
jgi:hypothetical protein